MKDRVVIVEDLHLNAEDNAMLSAMFSRKKEHVSELLEKVKSNGSKKFIDKYYIGYGHDSIGDLASLTICIHDISILAAKAIEQFNLSSYQETSTRYVNFSNHDVVVESDTTDFWLKEYEEKTKSLGSYYSDKYPDISDAGINAKVLDITSSLLPVSIKTNIAWHANIRNIRKHISNLLLHPLEEVRSIGQEILDAAIKQYPSSFSKLPKNSIDMFYDEIYIKCDPVEIISHMDTKSLMYNEMESLVKRNTGELPHRLDKYGYYNIKGVVCYASYRELQRHRRNLYLSMPLLKSSHGFCDYYIKELTHVDKDISIKISDKFKKLATISGIDYLNRQYLYPLGTNVVFEWVCTLPQLLYVMELRSKPNCRHTLRHLMYNIYNLIKLNHKGMKFYINMEEVNYEKRAKQTIGIKP
jgi:thymidylate synthase ThyX